MVKMPEGCRGQGGDGGSSSRQRAPGNCTRWCAVSDRELLFVDPFRVEHDPPDEIRASANSAATFWASDFNGHQKLTRWLRREISYWELLRARCHTECFAHACNVHRKIHPFTQQTVISPTGKGCLIYRGSGINNSVCCGGRGDSSSTEVRFRSQHVSGK